MREGLLLPAGLDVAERQVVVALRGLVVGGASDLEDVDQRALGEGDRVLELEAAEVVGGEQVVELGEDGVELSEVLGGHADELVALLDVLLPVLVLQVPLDLHQQQLEVAAAGLHLLRGLVEPKP